MLKKLVDKYKLDAKVERIDDIHEIMKYDVRIIPVLVINEEVKIKGRTPSEEELFKLLKM